MEVWCNSWSRSTVPMEEQQMVWEINRTRNLSKWAQWDLLLISIPCVSYLKNGLVSVFIISSHLLLWFSILSPLTVLIQLSPGCICQLCMGPAGIIRGGKPCSSPPRASTLRLILAWPWCPCCTTWETGWWRSPSNLLEASKLTVDSTALSQLGG